jgi:protein-S-isoprenylcysteine O-methyltransferase Ste14
MKSVLFFSFLLASSIVAKQTFFFLLIVCAVTHIIRTAYEILKHKQTLEPGKLSFVIMFINMIILWITWILLCSYDIYKLKLPAVIRYTGLSIAGMGLILFLTGLFTIKTLESYDGDLIKTGIYSKIRHPMYTGFILWLIGFPIYFRAGFSLIISLLFIINILFWRHLEEQELENRFPSYLDYKKTTIF